MSLRDLGRSEEALAVLVRAVDCQRRALELLPDRENYQATLRSLLRGLTEIHIALRKPLAAIVAAESWMNSAPPDRAEWEELANRAADIAALATGMPALSAEDLTVVFSQSVRVAARSLQEAAARGFPNLAAIRHDPRFSVLRADPTFSAIQEQAVDSQDRSPTRFSFDYPYEDPGKRVWTRSGDRWTEVQPSGKTNVFEITRRIRLGGVSGTEGEQTDGSGLRIFIPDKKHDGTMGLTISVEPDKWIFVGTIGDVE